MLNRRITDVDFVESLESDESFFINKNSSIKQINKGKVIFEITNGGTGATNASDARANLKITPENIGAQSKHIARTITLSADGWSDSKQAVSISEVTPDNTVFVSPSPDSFITYGENGIYCSSQLSGGLTFTCDSVPPTSVSVNVVIFG